MKLSVFSLALVSFLPSSPTFAEDRIELNSIYPPSQEFFQLSDRIYFMQDNRGYFEVIEGPIEEGPVRCVGGGFGMRDGKNSIQGICVFGEADNTFTMLWKAGEQGEANTWTIDGGTGRFDGMTGQGIATTGVETMYKAMPLRQSHIVGVVNIPEN